MNSGLLGFTVLHCSEKFAKQSEVGIMPIRVLLADDSEIVRRAIRNLLRSQPEIELVGEAADFRQTIRMMNDLNPEVIVLDLHMPDGTESTLLDVRSHLSHGSRLLPMSAWNDESTKALADSLGTFPLLDKMELSDKLIPTIMQLVSPQNLDSRRAI
jgi:two-component system response regulator DevR